jgi:pimeloyl-ACP methyl ester carboxylesterase
MKGFLPFSIITLPGVVAPADALAQDTPIKQGFSRAAVDGVELEYQTRGAGEAVVLVHAGIFADWFAPLLEEAALTSRYRVVSYHRVGYAGSSHPVGPISIAQQAGHLRSLMRHLGIERAHLVGHSSGGNIAIQLALDAPNMVSSLVIMEPALPVAPTGTQQPLLAGTPRGADAAERYRAGDKAGAVDAFMQMVAGQSYRAPLEEKLPGAFQQAVADADAFFGQELPAIRQWSLSREDASRVRQPLLAVIGEKSPEVSPIWVERQRMLLTWFPDAQAFVVPGTTHLLHVQNPRAVAEGLAAFFASHPINTR